MTLQNSIGVDILPISWAILFAYGAKWTKPLHALNTKEYLSVRTGKYYRGLFAIFVVLHHLSRRAKTGLLFPYVKMVGYMPVAVFFFLSGYGLQKSYITKSEQYQKGFLQKRIPSVLLPYIIITAAYWLMYWADGKHLSFIDIFLAIADGNPIVLYSWFIVNILIFYVVYWLLMLICRKHYFSMILGATAWYFLHVLICIRIGFGFWWYSASHLLIVGMCWATYEQSIIEFIKKEYFVIAPIVWATLIIPAVFYTKNAAAITAPYISTVLTCAASVAFVLCVIMFSLKIQIGNKALGLLGEISLEIYLLHGFFMDAFRSNFIFIENELLWCVLVLAGTITFSYVFHTAFQFVLQRYRKMLCKATNVS